MLTNTWYMAAWRASCSGQASWPHNSESTILMFRKARWHGSRAGDRCPHRFAPLHRGRQVGDVVQCGYHGLEFGADGAAAVTPRRSIKAKGRGQFLFFPLWNVTAMVGFGLVTAEPMRS